MGLITTPPDLLKAGYELRRPLGAGSTAEVFVAVDTRSGLEVALKISHFDAHVAARMETACNVAQTLVNKRLVGTYGGGRLDDGRAWMAMELLIGQDLDTRLQRQGRLRAGPACEVARQIFEALRTLHPMGVVHRDIKPENIFLQATPDGEISLKLIDLGLIALAGEDPRRAHEATGPVVMGTPLYLAPEIAHGAKPSASSDVYAVGAVLYHMLTGEPPFPGQDPVAVMTHHIQTPAPGLPEELPQPLRELVAQCLEKRPEARITNAQSAIERLTTVMDLLASEPRTPDAITPPIPEAGDVADWHRFADALLRQTNRWWPGAERPPEVQGAIERMQSTRGRLGHAEREAFGRRSREDARTRARTQDQDRLSAQMPHVEDALEAAIHSRNAVLDDLGEHLAERAAIDKKYAAALDTLRQGDPFIDLDAAQSTEILPIARILDGLLVTRDQIEHQVATARDQVLAAGEHVSMLLAERLELQRTLGDLLLDEQDQGRRLTMLSDISADAETAAGRDFEAACLVLYQVLVRQSEAGR